MERESSDLREVWIIRAVRSITAAKDHKALPDDLAIAFRPQEGPAGPEVLVMTRWQMDQLLPFFPEPQGFDLAWDSDVTSWPEDVRPLEWRNP